MSVHYTYLLIDLLSILFPLLFSFDKRISFYRYWRWLLPGLIITGGFFIAWDVLFTQQGVWSFNDQYIIGLKFFGLPLEEWLFFLAIPYSCVFVYQCLQYYMPGLDDKNWGWKLTRPLGILLLITGLVFTQKAYTFTSFSICGFVLILLHAYRSRLTYLNIERFYVSYLFSLIPFFIVNGLLTSLPVVLYNNKENLGVRMYTIPIEDTFYGLLLLLGNITIMEWAKHQSLKKARPVFQ